MEIKKRKRTSLLWKIRKQRNWVNLNWDYVKRVLLTEREIGGELHAC